MTNIEELHMLVKRLEGLLADPHPGLFAWQVTYRKYVDSLLKFWDAVPGEITRPYAPLPEYEDNEE